MSADWMAVHWVDPKVGRRAVRTAGCLAALTAALRADLRVASWVARLVVPMAG